MLSITGITWAAEDGAANAAASQYMVKIEGMT
jgi:hypothetical protein